MSYTEEELRGNLTVQNVSGGTLVLARYGAYSFAVDESVDLLDPSTPAALRAGTYSTAQLMVGQASVGVAPRNTTTEIAQKISAGDLAVTVDTQPSGRPSRN